MTKPAGIFAAGDLLQYKQRVTDVAQYMGTNWGAQTSCALDLGEQNITISRVVRGIEVDIELLVKIEGWIATQVLGDTIIPAVQDALNT